MKNVTITLDDETHRNARIRAAEMGTSLSALVKDYLQSLVETPIVTGVREMPMTYNAGPAQAVPSVAAAPFCSDGPPIYTKDGKSRKPGALRGMWVADDADEWPDGFIDAVYGEDTPASNSWWLNANEVSKKSKPK
jgi:Family of unknown function (DUF6364)